LPFGLLSIIFSKIIPWIEKFSILLQTKIKDFVITDNSGDIMTVREVAEYLKIAEKTAYRLVLDKKIPGFKVGNAWRFRAKEIDEWIKKQTKKM